MLLERHSVDDAQEMQDIKNSVDTRRGNCDQQRTTGNEVIRASAGERKLRIGRNMLEDRKHADDVEPIVGRECVGEMAAAKRRVRRYGPRRLDERINADVLATRWDLVKKRTVG